MLSYYHGRLMWGLILTSTLFHSLSIAQQETPKELINFQNITVNQSELQHALQALPPAEQNDIRHNLKDLQKLVRQVYLQKRMAAEAERLDLDKTPSAQIQLETQKQQKLAEFFNEYLRQQVGSPDFSALAKEHYAVHRDQFQTSEQFRVAYILKQARCDCERSTQRQRLESLQNDLKAGKDFATLAQTESEDAKTAPQGGDLGRWVKKSELLPPVANTLAKLETGQISDIVETPTELFLIKKLDYQPGRVQDFHEVQAKIEENLRQSYVQDQVQQKLLIYLPSDEASFNEPALRTLMTELEK